MSENKNSVISKFFSGKGFYMVLAGCLIAVGVAAWSAVAAINDQNTTKKPDNVNSYLSSEVPQIEEPVQNEVVDEPYSEPSDTSEIESQTTNTKPVAAYFVMPVSGSVEKEFDAKTLQYSATFQDMRLHLGVDIIAEKGASVVACGDGTVSRIYTDLILGTIIEIDHGNGIVARYCGMDENLLVDIDDVVTASQKIGTLGYVPGESADASHLHFEMLKNGKQVSPLKTMGIE
ncbi:MAG: peptidoglycan DD-metalloendopeptidase family protein [Clostridia bacterium]|nr:peptidoglycan DD-metalloendopeptidase family protein [Clostridia bacterium]